MNQNRVHIIFTGGTIAMRTNAHGQLVPANSGDELIAAIPALAHAAALSTHQLSNVASAHRLPSARAQRARTCIRNGVPPVSFSTDNRVCKDRRLPPAAAGRSTRTASP